jgi:hypothetical protein
MNASKNSYLLQVKSIDEKGKESTSSSSSSSSGSSSESERSRSKNPYKPVNLDNAISNL